MKKRRATVIYENELGILLVPDQRGTFMLPGGHAKRGEARIIAAIRELHEETKLSATEIKFLFEFESTNFEHKVFLVKADGIPVPSGELYGQKPAYFPIGTVGIPSEIRIMNSSMKIIQRYLSI